MVNWLLKAISAISPAEMAVPPVPVLAVVLAGTVTVKVSVATAVIANDLPLRTVDIAPVTPFISTVFPTVNKCPGNVITQEVDDAAWFTPVID